MNSQLLRDLEDRWSEWSSTQAIGDVFVKIIPFFQVRRGGGEGEWERGGEGDEGEGGREGERRRGGLLRDLEDRWSEWSSTQAIGDVFVKIIPFFQVRRGGEGDRGRGGGGEERGRGRGSGGQEERRGGLLRDLEDR